MSKVVTIEVGGKLQWRANREPGSKRWVAVCDAMNLAMEADTLDELHGLIAEAIHLMLTDLLADDELNRYLSDRGWRAINVPARKRDVEFHVPWQLIAEGARDSARRPH